ncbi:MAG: efflux RND transporter periplasmic adaptor subunit [Syntrophobacteraceae bacterium]|jgi:HlyD family secretion protein|nr:efflux RND transporter periplasmic adaptor subunit [Syntrophobacteraceae bacterium]
MQSRIAAPMILIISVAILAGLVMAYKHWIHNHPLPEGLIQANGRMEGDRITVSSKFSGRVQTMFVQEGDYVQSGQTLIILDDTQVRTRVSQAEKDEEALRARVEALRLDVEVLRRDVSLAIETAQAELDHMQALAAKAEAGEHQARRESLRMQRLAAEGAASRQKGEQSELAHAVARSELAASLTAVTGARKRLDQAVLGWDRIRVREGDLKETEARLGRSAAALAEARSILDDFVIKSPGDGVVLTRIANVGEMVGQGAPLLDLVDLDRLYLKVYVPEIQIGKVRLGLPARIHTDAFPDRAEPATVRMISSRAEFTPKEVQTPDERTKLVYAVKLYLDDNPDHSMTPGLPGDAVIRWKDDVPWMPPRW